MFDYLIVGAGLAGCVLAERLANESNKKVLLIDRRSHLGGNCYDEYNRDGILIHKYGPHLFHTNDKRIVEYLSQFTNWRQYEYRVLSSVNGKLVPMPINMKTINMIFDLKISTSEEVETFLKSVRENIIKINNSEDLVVSRVGWKLYELLYKNYTQKQWNIEPKLLSPSVCGRIPIRTSLDDRYFDDTYQLIPLNGYAEMFNRMIKHTNIEMRLNTEFKDVQNEKFNNLIYTGLIDEYFDYRYGQLPYRSLRFEYNTIEKEYIQPVASIHYPNEHLFTRTIEYKHITGQNNKTTTIVKEYPTSEGEPYYPIPTSENNLQYSKYQKETSKLMSVYFVGRMASYQYYNMDQVIAQGLNLFKNIANE